MSEEKLTVAELLARAGKEAAPSGGGCRRRRRSLEEGGISVADLTGGQPRVRAEGPRRGAHAADPEPEPAAEPEPAPERARRTPVTVADRAMRAGVPLATPVSPAPVMEVPEAGEITFTFTALHDAETASQPVAESGPMALEALGVFAEPEPEPRIEPEPQPEPEEPRTSSAAPAAPAVASIARPDEPTPGEARTDVQGAIRDEDLEEADRAGRVDDVDPSARTGVLPVIGDDGPAVAEADAADAAHEPAPAAPETRRRPRPPQREDDSLSYGLLVVQVLVGLLAGAALFLVFMVLWHSALPTVVMAVIALAVTGLLVAAANGLRRRRDTLTPILAGVVGLLLTFGPWLVSLF